eukprot:3420417-Rhodomonas_salina.2
MMQRKRKQTGSLAYSAAILRLSRTSLMDLPASLKLLPTSGTWKLPMFGSMFANIPAPPPPSPPQRPTWVIFSPEPQLAAHT